MFIERCQEFEKNHQKILDEEIIFLWYDDYYDGPLSGFLQYQNEFYWFDAYDFNDEDIDKSWYQKFIILKLSQQEIECEIAYQKLSIKFFGRINMFAAYSNEKNNNILIIPEDQIYHSKEMREYFWQFVAEDKNYRNNEIVGWFTL